MASVALDPVYRRIEVDEFLAMDFGGAKAELEDGLIYMMAGGTEAQSRIAGNIFVYSRITLRGSGCLPYNSDLAMRTAERTVRLADISVYCNDPAAPGNERKQLLGDPQIIFEILSPSTSSYDENIKLPEYRTLGGVREIILVDTVEERIRHVRRATSGDWTDGWLAAGGDLVLVSLDLIVPHAEVFARV